MKRLYVIMTSTNFARNLYSRIGAEQMLDLFQEHLPSLDLEAIANIMQEIQNHIAVTGRWSAKQRKVAALLNQVALLRQKFSVCQPFLVPRNEIKFAREAMTS
ncbi:hypothetical protein RND71_020987 [Anisodus tanguticus]|uniref:Uncharacterized protein n=1 Tax=Anisodus tanguticus TaxID=243964 RepID=A0AAE1RXB3_9SOLA|nr:hypothetical protein RND71_020987 [Anisodus tanguticus]